MNIVDIIFTQRFPYRFLRHSLFWIVWLAYIFIVYLLAPFYYWMAKMNINEIQPTHYLNWFIKSTLPLVIAHILIFYTFYFFLITTGSLIKKIGWAIIGFAVTLLIRVFFESLDLLLETLFYKKPDLHGWLVESIRDETYNVTTLLAFAVAIKYGKHWFETQRNQQTLIQEKLNTELQLLKAQIHPHFLFNTLNNIYSFILNSNPNAPKLILKLSNLMQYIITECNHSKVQLAKEIEMIESYLELEKIRYGNRLNLDLTVTGSPKNRSIAPLLLLPFIENSFKHGVSNQLDNPWIQLELTITPKNLIMKLNNSKLSDINGLAHKNKGIGLVNVQKRLQLLYPNQHTLCITSEPNIFKIYLEVAIMEN